MLETYLLPPESLQEGLMPPVHDAHLFYLLTLQEVMMTAGQGNLYLNIEQVNNISNTFLSNFSEEQISLYHFREFPRF